MDTLEAVRYNESAHEAKDQERNDADRSSRCGSPDQTLRRSLQAGGGGQLDQDGPVRDPDLAAENRALKAQLARVREQRDILKKTVGIFSEPSKLATKSSKA